ncbi:MAG: glycosyltransferase [Candidatus Omnitrophica bacterium]|nr:glycosyltransferase [Candidatus Omnitrophota bacterium]
MNESRISVVVPAYNCEKTIARCIECILGQSHPVDEIIIVDDGSTDRTAEIIKAFKTVQYVHQLNSGPASARNTGARQATGEFIFFTDSDCAPDKDWISLTIKHFSNASVAVVSGSYGIGNPESRLARCIHQEIIFRHQHLMPSYPKSFGSYNFGIRKEVFDQVGRFNESYRRASGEDNDLSYKILAHGYKIYFEPASIVDHIHPTKVIKYLKEQFRHGFWRVKMYMQHPNMAKGDDYTFWKDIVEIPIAICIVFFLLLSVFKFIFLVIAVTFIFLLGVTELYYGFLMLKKFEDRIFSGLVFFLRSFARAAGFLSGIMFFITKKS